MCIITDNLPLARSFVNAMWGGCPVIRRLDPLDAHQEARIGLIEAAKTWNPERGAFSTWARVHVFKRLYKAGLNAGTVRLPRISRPRRLQSPGMDKAFNRAMRVGGLTADLEGEDPNLAAADARADVADAFRYLPPRHQEILRLLFWEGEQVKAVARRLGLSRMRVHELRAEAFQKLRDLLGDDYGV